MEIFVIFACKKKRCLAEECKKATYIYFWMMSQLCHRCDTRHTVMMTSYYLLTWKLIFPRHRSP